MIKAAEVELSFSVDGQAHLNSSMGTLEIDLEAGELVFHGKHIPLNGGNVRWWRPELPRWDCPICGKEFDNAQGLGGHRAKAHPEALEATRRT